MELTLNRPLVILDVEATGDQINRRNWYDQTASKRRGNYF